MIIYTLDEIQDDLIGEIGTPRRDKFEHELKVELIAKTIKQISLDLYLTQEALGKLTEE